MKVIFFECLAKFSFNRSWRTPHNGSSLLPTSFPLPSRFPSPVTFPSFTALLLLCVCYSPAICIWMNVIRQGRQMKSKLSTQLQVELLLQIGAEILMHSNPYPYKRRHIWSIRKCRSVTGNETFHECGINRYDLSFVVGREKCRGKDSLNCIRMFNWAEGGGPESRERDLGGRTIRMNQFHIG